LPSPGFPSHSGRAASLWCGPAFFLPPRPRRCLTQRLATSSPGGLRRPARKVFPSCAASRLRAAGTAAATMIPSGRRAIIWSRGVVIWMAVGGARRRRWRTPSSQDRRKQAVPGYSKDNDNVAHPIVVRASRCVLAESRVTHGYQTGGWAARAGSVEPPGLRHARRPAVVCRLNSPVCWHVSGSWY